MDNIYNLLLKKKTLEKIDFKDLSNRSDRIKFRIEFLNQNILLEFSFTPTTEEPPYMKSNFKFIIKINNSFCFIVRLDLREEHLNPSFEDLSKETLQELEQLKESNEIIEAIFSLLKKYEEFYFERDKGHIHLFVKDDKECDKWAVPIEDFVELINNILKIGIVTFDNEIILSDKKKLIENVKNFLLMLNFNINKLIEKKFEEKIQTFQLVYKQISKDEE